MGGEGSLGLDEIGQIALTVEDLSQSVSFYRDVLGLRLLFEVPHMAFFDCGGVRLMLSEPEEGRDQPESVLYYRVADIWGAYDALRGRGVRFEGEPHKIADLDDHELWMVFFRDAGGRLAAIMHEARG